MKLLGLIALVVLGFVLWGGLFGGDDDQPERSYSSPASTTGPDAVDYAYALCTVMDATGLLTEPCEVSGWDSAVDVRMDTSASEARQICQGAAQMVRAEGADFGRGWMLRIYSPYSGESTLAQCSL